jgi:hypothetical protein
MTTVAEGIDLPFEEAISYFKQKTRIPTERWSDVWKEAHARGFMVAGAASDALLKDFQDAIQKALSKGTSAGEFRKDFDAIVKRHGWKHTGKPGWRASIIYDTNMANAFAAGRYAQMSEPAVLKHFPYWQYRHTACANPRLMHLSWDGMTLRADDPWWDEHYPPNGWRCGCRVASVSREGLARMGKRDPDTAPPRETREWIDPKTGEIHRVPVGIDPGFDWNPGKAWQAGKAAEMPMRASPLRPVTREPDLTEKQIETLRGFIAKPEGDLPVADLPALLQRAIGAPAPRVVLPADTVKRQAARAVPPSETDYLLARLLLEEPDLVLGPPQGNRQFVLRLADGLLAAGVRPAPGAARVTSLRRITPATLRRMMRRTLGIWGSALGLLP